MGQMPVIWHKQFDSDGPKSVNSSFSQQSGIRRQVRERVWFSVGYTKTLVSFQYPFLLPLLCGTSLALCTSGLQETEWLLVNREEHHDR
jgi:hypothetical protein